MSVKHVYLDSSAIVKRYITEKGSDVVDKVYEKAENGQLKVVFSIWNVGEVLGVFNRYFRRGLLSKSQLETRIIDFIQESVKFAKMNFLYIAPITAYELVHSWLVVLEQHVYMADALQICTCKNFKCDFLLSADNVLIKASSNCGISSFNVEIQKNEIYKLLP